MSSSWGMLQQQCYHVWSVPGLFSPVFIYDSVRVSMEARRRSDALADARLKRKEPPPVEPPSTLSKCTLSMMPYSVCR